MPHQSSGIYMPNTDRHHVIIVIISSAGCSVTSWVSEYNLSLSAVDHLLGGARSWFLSCLRCSSLPLQFQLLAVDHWVPLQNEQT